MFLRKNRKRFDGEVYEYWTLCQTVRTERGPRQQVVATLGKFTEEDLAAGWEDLEALLEGRRPGPKQRELFGRQGDDEPVLGWELADLQNLGVERVREFGSVFLALTLWRRLGLHELLAELIEPGREEIAWAEVAAVLTVGKFCGQASELGIAEEWYARTALEDLCGIPVESVNDDRLYRALDIVGTPKSRLRDYQTQLAEKENWVDVENGVEARLVDHPDGDGQERYVLCRSQARGAKERAMLERQMTALTEQMMKIDRALQRRAPSDLGKIERRIGRWQGKYPAAARLLEVALRQDGEGRVCGLQLSCPVRETGHPLLAKGAYLLRTNCTETDPAKLWRWYIQLTQAEAAFRTAKSDLGLRPIYHQKTDRVEAHLLICFLSLALWRSSEMWMQCKSLGSSARKVVAACSTIRSMDVTVPVKRAERVLTLRLRTVAKPDADVALLLTHLGLRLPKGSKLVQNVVEKKT